MNELEKNIIFKGLRKIVDPYNMNERIQLEVDIPITDLQVLQTVAGRKRMKEILGKILADKIVDNFIIGE